MDAYGHAWWCINNDLYQPLTLSDSKYTDAQMFISLLVKHEALKFTTFLYMLKEAYLKVKNFSIDFEETDESGCFTQVHISESFAWIFVWLCLTSLQIEPYPVNLSPEVQKQLHNTIQELNIELPYPVSSFLYLGGGGSPIFLFHEGKKDGCMLCYRYPYCGCQKNPFWTLSNYSSWHLIC